MARDGSDPPTRRIPLNHAENGSNKPKICAPRKAPKIWPVDFKTAAFNRSATLPRDAGRLVDPDAVDRLRRLTEWSGAAASLGSGAEVYPWAK